MQKFIKYVLILNPDTILNDKTIPNLLVQATIHKDFAIMGPRVIENENIKIPKLYDENLKLAKTP